MTTTQIAPSVLLFPSKEHLLKRDGDLDLGFRGMLLSKADNCPSKTPATSRDKYVEVSIYRVDPTTLARTKADDVGARWVTSVVRYAVDTTPRPSFALNVFWRADRHEATVCSRHGSEVVSALRDSNGYLGEVSKQALALAAAHDPMLAEVLVERVT